jgi:hypothetical protein
MRLKTADASFSKFSAKHLLLFVLSVMVVYTYSLWMRGVLQTALKEVIVAGGLAVCIYLLMNGPAFAMKVNRGGRIDLMQGLSLMFRQGMRKRITFEYRETVLHSLKYLTFVTGLAIGGVGYFILSHFSLKSSLVILGLCMGLYSYSLLLPSTDNLFRARVASVFVMYGGISLSLGLSIGLLTSMWWLLLFTTLLSWVLAFAIYGAKSWFRERRTVSY